MSIKPFGSHLIVDADCCEGNITDKNHIQEFINQLVAKLGMKKMGDTQFIYFEDNSYNRERDIVGYSVFQCISLSSIVIHINEISKTIYLDCFTCSQLNESDVILLFSDFFKAQKIKKQIIVRDAKI